MAQSVDVQITEAEERFLRGFVRRQVLPWFGVCLLMALILSSMAFAVATSIAKPVLSESSRAVGQARVLATLESEDGAGAAAAPEDWEAQLLQLRTDLETRFGKSEAGVTKLTTEVATAVKEVKTLRDRVARAERAAKSGKASGSGPELASADLNRVLKRLQGLETRQNELESKREKFAQDTLKRLLNVEVGRDQAEQNRLANDERSRARLQNIEERLSHVEGGGTPAATP